MFAFSFCSNIPRGIRMRGQHEENTRKMQHCPGIGPRGGLKRYILEMRRTQSDCGPTLPGARIHALPAAPRPPEILRIGRPAQALGPCRQGPRLNAVTAPGSGRPARSWSPGASPPMHRGPSCDRARGYRNGGTRARRRSPKTPGSIDTGGTNARWKRVQRCQAPPMRPASTTPRPNPCAWRSGRAPLRWRGGSAPLRPARSPAKAAAGRAQRALLRRRGLRCGGSAWRLALPGRRCGCGLARNG